MSEYDKVDLEHLRLTGEIRFIGKPDLTVEQAKTIIASPDTIDQGDFSLAERGVWQDLPPEEALAYYERLEAAGAKIHSSILRNIEELRKGETGGSA